MIEKTSGVQFEQFCKDLVEHMGFSAQLTKTVGDGGIDIIAKTNQAFISGKYIIQCKRYAGSVGEPVIRDLYGVVMSENANKGILITSGRFTSSAIEFATNKQIELVDGDRLKELCQKYNISFDSNESYDFLDKLFPYYALSRQIAEQPNNYSIKSKMLDELYLAVTELSKQVTDDIIYVKFYEKDDGNDIDLDEDVENFRYFEKLADERRNNLNLAIKQLQELFEFFNAIPSNSRRIIYYKTVISFRQGIIAIWEGKYDEALKYFFKYLESPVFKEDYELSKDYCVEYDSLVYEDQIFVGLFNVTQIFNITKNEKKSLEFRRNNIGLFNIISNQNKKLLKLSENNSLIKYYNWMVSYCESPTTIEGFYYDSLHSRSKPSYETVVYGDMDVFSMYFYDEEGNIGLRPNISYIDVGIVPTLMDLDGSITYINMDEINNNYRFVIENYQMPKSL